MNQHLVRNIQNQIQTLSRTVFKLESIYCHFTAFTSKEVTWKERLELRKKLVKELKHRYSPIADQKVSSVSVKILEDLLKPGKNLKNPLAAISISHCPSLGGFIFSFDKGFFLGLDVELAYRLTDKLLSRISTKEELKMAPGAAFLWTAKEAGFKCASSLEKATKLLISQCLISQWQRIEPESYCFHFQMENSKCTKGQGFAFIIEGLVLAAAIV